MAIFFCEASIYGNLSVKNPSSFSRIAGVLPLIPSRCRPLPSSVAAAAHFLPLIASLLLKVSSPSLPVLCATPQQQLCSNASSTRCLYSTTPLALCSMTTPQICDVNNNYSPTSPLLNEDDDDSAL
ncbi:uncharacterized protein DS421_9g262300 [Arachis hypogaea]|nr:uncharacterized protein DS421_9g262300 [Arachis hypogaea]